MDWPKEIVLADLDGGYIYARLDEDTVINKSKSEIIPVYSQIDYYHSVDSIEKAIKDYSNEPPKQ